MDADTFRLICESDRLIPRFGVDQMRTVAKMTPSKRWATLVHHAHIAAVRTDAASLRRAIIAAAGMRNLDTFEEAVLASLMASYSGCLYLKAAQSDAIAFLCSSIGRVRMDIDDFVTEESAIPAVTAETARLSPDRRRSNLTRMAFRALRAGTTRLRLNSLMTEANGTLSSPLSSGDLESLTGWCVARHLEEIAARKSPEVQSHAA